MTKRRSLKRMITVILTLCMLMSILAVGVTNVSAATYISSDGQWKFFVWQDGVIQLDSYLGNETSITLPETIDGYTMNSVYMFKAGTLQHIHIPKNYQNIGLAENKSLISVTFDRDYTEPTVDLDGFGAFYKCKNLKKVVLPNLVADTGSIEADNFRTGVWLEHATFKDCEKLEEVVLPTNIQVIGSECFENCKSLKSLEIPEGVIEIGLYAITGCTSMEYLYLPESLKQTSPIQMSSNRTIICPTGSYAEEYLKAKADEYEQLGLDIAYTFINSTPTDIIGDANGDNELDITDVTLIQKRLVKIYPFDITNYDTNGDNKISISDATEIQRKLANII